jgi:hypothetical protein
MSFFSSKPKDGPGFVRITYCGNVKVPGGVGSGFASKILGGQVSNAAAGQKNITQALNSNSIQDAAGKLIARSTNYQIGQYTGYNESKSQPGKFYHDFRLVNPEDSFCHSGGIKKRSRKSKSNRKRVTKRRNTKRRFNKSRSRR